MGKKPAMETESGKPPAKKAAKLPAGKTTAGTVAAKSTGTAPLAAATAVAAVGDDWPAWKVELLEMLDQHTQVPLVQQLKSGILKEDISLFLNLNLSTQWVQSKAFAFNQLIKRHSKAKKLKFVSTNELSECDTLAQLLKLIGSRM